MKNFSRLVILADAARMDHMVAMVFQFLRQCIVVHEIAADDDVVFAHILLAGDEAVGAKRHDGASHSGGSDGVGEADEPVPEPGGGGGTCRPDILMRPSE